MRPFPLVTFDPSRDEDVVEAAVACDSCRDLHCAIFDKPDPKPLPLYFPPTYSSEGEE